MILLSSLFSTRDASRVPFVFDALMAFFDIELIENARPVLRDASSGWTPLHFACVRGDVGVVRQVLDLR